MLFFKSSPLRGCLGREESCSQEICLTWLWGLFGLIPGILKHRELLSHRHSLENLAPGQAASCFPSCRYGTTCLRTLSGGQCSLLPLLILSSDESKEDSPGWAHRLPLIHSRAWTRGNARVFRCTGWAGRGLSRAICQGLLCPTLCPLVMFRPQTSGYRTLVFDEYWRGCTRGKN